MPILLAAVLVAGVANSTTPIREYRIDAGHSDVAFSIGFLGHQVRGRFDDIKGPISYAANDLEASSITVVIAAKSIATGSAHRDEHLRSADFFDAATYPFIVFRSTSIRRRGDSAIMTGTLDMHGVSRTVVIPFSSTPPVADPHGNSLVYFSGQLRLARKDFGVLGGSKHNDWFDDLRSVTMADSVDVSLDISAWDPDVDRTPAYSSVVSRVEHNGVEATLARLRAMPRDSLAGAEYQFDQVARGLQDHGRNADAIAIMQFSAALFDRKAAVHASLARTFELAGQVDSARVHTMRALALDSLDTHARELSRRLQLDSPR